MTVDALHKRMNQRFTRLGRRMNARFTVSDARFDAIDHRLAEVLQSIGKLTEKLDQHVQNSNGYFKHFDTVVGEYQKRLKDLEPPPSA